MRVSVIIPTRDRPDDLARCLPTVLANDYPNFEVIVVDQSTDDASQQMVSSIGDARLRYHRQQVSGKSRALNAALAQAKGEIMALTDDDCTVPADWLQRAVAVLAKEPQAGVVFGALAAVPHDRRQTLVPTFLPPHYRRLEGRLARRNLWVGVGANMLIRRAVFDRLTGFDEHLGPGSRFRSGDDVDLAYRALRAGFAVVHDPDNIVLHWGRRDYANGSARRMYRNYYYGVGARLVKYLRCGDPIAAYLLLREVFKLAVEVIPNLIRRRHGTGAGRLISLVQGAVRGFRQPADHQRQLFSPAGPYHAPKKVKG